MKKLGVLQIIDRLGPGGAESLLYTLASGLDRERFELHVCGLRDGSMYVLASRIEAVGVPVMQLNQRNAYDIPTLMTLVRYIRKHNIGVIHTHLLAADIMGRMAGFLTRTPVVSTVHSSRDDFDHEPARRRLMERWTGRLLCRRLIVVSESIRKEIAEWYGVPQKRIVAIANGVDTGRFRPRPELDKAALKRDLLGDACEDGNCPLVLTVARLVPPKGLSHLLDAAKQVCAARPDVRFAIAGIGPLQEELQREAETLGLGGKLVFGGERNDVPELLASCDLFVLSSVSEGLPIALLEAMSAGCSVVATDVGGVGAVVQDGVTGLVVPPGDPGALVEAILASLNDPEAAKKRGAEAQQWVTSHYGMSAWARKLERLYLHEAG